MVVAVAVAVAGCSKTSSGIDVGKIKQLSIKIETSREDPPGYYLGVRFDIQPPHEDLDVRAACQVENRRYVDVGPTQLDAHARPGDMPPSVPFIDLTLAKRPELCELTFFLESAPATPLGVVCARTGKPPVAGPCPVNPVDGAGTAAGFSVPSLLVQIEPGDKRFSVDYVVQAHRDQDPKTSIQIKVSCKDGSTDEDERSMPGGLRAGESFRAFYNAEVADPNGPCSVVVSAPTGMQPLRETIETFCATGGTVTRGACPD
jgi:hypothetical protein